MIDIQFADNLTKDEEDALWEQGVRLEDWDYLIIVPASCLIESTTQTWEGETVPQFTVNYPLDRLLNGCCSNKWHKVTFRGKECGVGVAYHA